MWYHKSAADKTPNKSPVSGGLASQAGNLRTLKFKITTPSAIVNHVLPRGTQIENKRKILIVDPDIRTLSALVGFLSDEPYGVFTAADGTEGLDILRQEKIDVAIAEMDLAGLDGLALLKCAKAENIQTPILIMSGVASMELTEEIFIAGAASVFDKPISKHRFLAKIKRQERRDNPAGASRDSGRDDAMQYEWQTELESFLNAHYRNPDLNFGDLMRRFRFSRSHGCALFKVHLGMTFQKKLREIRVAQARRLIEASHLFMNEIADQCGFRSAKRLCEAFKKIHGLTPVAYRKNGYVSIVRHKKRI